ncbi:MAG: tRNA (5-methylaminomethyl-2-thiouridine)(34)-methyltransferase MnmD [Bacteroidetes bacterium]|nr:tRNA (5-methylaminomethyl-2-thiouridine)(34)-methyltransferase MnmD [Bacteroidota bacterium]
MNLPINTNDGSHTIYSELFNEHYHSTFGALSESMHVFIEAGLNHCSLNHINIFEVGFGTGLNAVLTYAESKKQKLNINYTAIELYPVDIQIIEKLNYQQFLSQQQYKKFILMHSTVWNTEVDIDSNFTLTKIKSDLTNFNMPSSYDIIYFDAFSPNKQPEIWSLDIFKRIYASINQFGILTTYSSKGLVKNNLRNAGFKVTRLVGPKGKHHIIRAEKN